MTNQSSQKYSKPPDMYAEHRCVNCRHLRYANQQPGDPCQICDCVEHVVPSEVAATGAQPPEGGDAA